jgi:hypothetical protein
LPIASHEESRLESTITKKRVNRAKPRKPLRNDLLIIECNSSKLAADRLGLGVALARFLDNDIARIALPNRRIVLVKTSTEVQLQQDLAKTCKENGRFRSILVVGHSNQAGLELTGDGHRSWNVVGKWLQPFAPEFVFLAACEAGRSAAVRDLFIPMRKTLRQVFASPSALHVTQASPLLLLILMLLKDGKIDGDHSGAMRFSNYVLTGGQLFRWTPEEIGPGEEVRGASWDGIASWLNHGEWDLAELVCRDVARNRHSNR